MITEQLGQGVQQQRFAKAARAGQKGLADHPFESKRQVRVFENKYRLHFQVLRITRILRGKPRPLGRGWRARRTQFAGFFCNTFVLLSFFCRDIAMTPPTLALFSNLREAVLLKR